MCIPGSERPQEVLVLSVTLVHAIAESIRTLSPDEVGYQTTIHGHLMLSHNRFALNNDRV